MQRMAAAGARGKTAYPAVSMRSTDRAETGWNHNKWLGRWCPTMIARQDARDAARCTFPCPPVPVAQAKMPSPGPTVRTMMTSDDGDRGLVEQIQAGDVRAFEALHRRYHARIYRFAYMRLGNAEDAADVAATTFVKALNRIGSFEFRRGGTIYPWLHQIASNCVIDAVRDRPPGGTLSLDAQAAEDVDSFLEYLPADGPSQQDLVERDEVRQLVRAAINVLPADQARAVTLRFLDDQPIREIAGALNRSEGAVKSLLHRALQGMRQHLRHTIANTRARHEEGAGTENSLHSRTGSHGQESIHIHQSNA